MQLTVETMTSPAPTIDPFGESLVPSASRNGLVGAVLDGRYRVGSLLAEGGMASVHVAVDERLDRPVAVKVMHPALAADPRFVSRFREEARSAARLSHPHVVAVTDQGVDRLDDGTPVVFLVMELVDGITVRDLLHRQTRLRPEQVLELLEPICAALGAAHEAGLVHRDVKPENVLLGDDGRVLVADFGLARAVEAAPVTAAAGLLLGTVAYLAPEQVSHGRADARTDVYALGVMTFELLTGEVPFQAATPLAVAYRHLHERVPSPSSLVGGIPAGLDALVAAATQPDPDARPADARVLLGMVRRLQREMRGGSPTPPTEAQTAVLVMPPSSHTAVLPVPAPFRPLQPLSPTQPRPPVVAQAPRRHPTAPLELPPTKRRIVTRGRVVLLVLLLVTALAGAGGWWLADGRWTHAPKLVGLTASQSTELGQSADVKTVLGDSVYDDTVGQGLVASQDPPVGTRVQRGHAVTVHVSLGAHTVPVPTLRSASQQNATDALTAAGLTLGNVTQAYDPTVSVGGVISSSPGEGSAVRLKSAVDLVISKGPQPVPVPGVLGRTKADAEASLEAAEFPDTTTDVFDDNTPIGSVVAQTPAPGQLLAPGQTVTLQISKGPDVVVVPDVRGDSSGTADATLRAAGLVPDHSVVPGGTDSLVVSQSDRGKTVKRGSTITLYTV